jgi:hypothetical protein
VDETGLGSGQVAGSGIHGAEPSVSVKIKLITKLNLKKTGCGD